MSVASLKFVTLKTVFLITLATGRRRSEIHSICHSGISFTEVDGNLTYSLPVHADFLAKNQLASKGQDITKGIYITSLRKFLGPDLWDSEDRFLCPVRALKYYLTHTKQFRRKRLLLFIPYSLNIDRELCSSTISGYIVQAIHMAYSEKDLVTLLQSRGVNIKAHQVKSAASSWAFLMGKTSMQQLMNACFWRSQTTFASHYLHASWTNELDDHYFAYSFHSSWRFHST